MSDGSLPLPALIVLVVMTGALVGVVARAVVTRRREDAARRARAMAQVEAARAALAVWVSDPRFVVHVEDGGRWGVLDPSSPPRTPPPVYAVTYRDGPLVALVGRGARPPPGTPLLKPSRLPIPDLPGDDALTDGARRVRTEVGPSPAGGTYHRVSLTNVSDGRVRVRWFGAWSRGEPPAFDTVTGRPFTAEDFRRWYAVPDPDGWLAPGERVDDPVSYGGGIWVFGFETDAGEPFVVALRR